MLVQRSKQRVGFKVIWVRLSLGSLKIAKTICSMAVHLINIKYTSIYQFVHCITRFFHIIIITKWERGGAVGPIIKIILYLASIVQDLMLIFLHIQNVLKHVIQLFFAQNKLRSCSSHSLRLLSRVFFTTVDCIKLSHP